jgi:hypothetical protein
MYSPDVILEVTLKRCIDHGEKVVALVSRITGPGKQVVTGC